jgi:precorrin-6A/cobalt-precorrin-6A reductase
MILLFGGTSETAPIASALATAGFRVFVSTATDAPLDVGDHPNISRRAGKLDREQMLRLSNQQDVIAIVDASHPYAASVHANARSVADQLKIPYLSWIRPPILEGDSQAISAPDHDAAAKVAFSFGLPVLLTTGSRNLEPYARESSATGVRLVVRVLSQPDSMDACRKAGISDDNIVSGRGPFSIQENLSVIKQFGIGVLVTKESGVAGGVPEKLKAAHLACCRVVLVQRPAKSSGAQGFNDVSELVQELCRLLSHPNLVHLPTHQTRQALRDGGRNPQPRNVTP